MIINISDKVTETVGPKPSYKPYGNVLFLDYKPAAIAGQIHLPNGAKPLHEFVTCKVTAAGSGAELVKAGDTILIATKAILGVKHDGQEVYVTQENTILAVIEGL